VFTGRYQATHVLSRDRYIATAIHATVLHCIGIHAYIAFCSYFAKGTRFKTKLLHSVISQTSGQNDEALNLKIENVCMLPGRGYRVPPGGCHR
jgi:hypothetical protein